MSRWDDDELDDLRSELVEQALKIRIPEDHALMQTIIDFTEDIYVKDAESCEVGGLAAMEDFLTKGGLWPRECAQRWLYFPELGKYPRILVTWTFLPQHDQEET